MSLLEPLPTHVLARVLYHATLQGVVRVAHASRALHARIAGTNACQCAAATTFDRDTVRARTLDFWTHWKLCGGRVRTWEWKTFVRADWMVHVDYALHAGMPPQVDNQWAIGVACAWARLPLIERLLRDPRVDPSMDDQFPLIRAVTLGHADVVRRLLKDSRVDPSGRGNGYAHTALCVASYHGHVELVRLLLCDARVNPAAQGHQAVRMAARGKRIVALDLLLRDPRVDHERLLASAAFLSAPNNARLIRQRVALMNQTPEAK